MIKKYATHAVLGIIIAITALPNISTAVGLHQANISQWYPLLQKPYNVNLQNALTSYSAKTVRPTQTVTESFNVFGQVRDGLSNAPQTNARVELKKFDTKTQQFVTVQTEMTDATGNYGFINLDPNDTYGLVAETAGYEPFMYYHIAIDDETVTMHIPLVKIRK